MALHQWSLRGAPNVPKLDREVVTRCHKMRILFEELGGRERVDKVREEVFLLPVADLELHRRSALEGGLVTEVADVQKALRCRI